MLTNIEGTIISFCTNTMLDRGRVFNCRITDGRAVVETCESWDCMRFAEIQHRIGEDLGIVVETNISGSLQKTLAIRNDRGINYLFQGRG